MTSLTIPQTPFSASAAGSSRHSSPIGAAANSSSKSPVKSLKGRLPNPLPLGRHLSQLLPSPLSSPGSSSSEDGKGSRSQQPLHSTATTSRKGSWLGRKRAFTDAASPARGGSTSKGKSPTLTSGGIGESPHLPTGTLNHQSPPASSHTHSYSHGSSSGRSGHRRRWGSTDTTATSVYSTQDTDYSSPSRVHPSAFGTTTSLGKPVPASPLVDGGRRRYPGSFVASLGLAPIAYGQDGSASIRIPSDLKNLPPTPVSGSSAPGTGPGLGLSAFGVGDGGKLIPRNIKPAPTADSTFKPIITSAPSTSRSVPFPSPGGVQGSLSSQVQLQPKEPEEPSVRPSASLPDLRAATDLSQFGFPRRPAPQPPVSQSPGLAFDIQGGSLMRYAAPKPKLFARPLSSVGVGEKRGAPDEDDAVYSEVFHIRSTIPEGKVGSPVVDRPKKRLSAERVMRENLASQVERIQWARSISRANSMGVRQRRPSLVTNMASRSGENGALRGSKYRVKRRATDAGVFISPHTRSLSHSASTGSPGIGAVPSRRPSAPPTVLRKRSRSRSSTRRRSYLTAQRPAPAPPTIVIPDRTGRGSAEDGGPASPPVPTSFDMLLGHPIRKRSRAGSVGAASSGSGSRATRLAAWFSGSASNGAGQSRPVDLNRVAADNKILHRKSVSVPELRRASARASQLVRGQDQELMERFKLQYGLASDQPPKPGTIDLVPGLKSGWAEASGSSKPPEVSYGTAVSLLPQPEAVEEGGGPSLAGSGGGRAVVTASKEREVVATPPSKRHMVFAGYADEQEEQSEPVATTQTPPPTSTTEAKLLQPTAPLFSLPRPPQSPLAGTLSPAPRKRHSPASNHSGSGSFSPDQPRSHSPVPRSPLLAFPSVSSPSRPDVDASSPLPAALAKRSPSTATAILEGLHRRNSSSSSRNSPMASPTSSQNRRGSGYFPSILGALSRPSSPQPPSPVATFGNPGREEAAEDGDQPRENREEGSTSAVARQSSDSSHSSIDLDKFIDQDSLFYRAPTKPRPELIKSYSDSLASQGPAPGSASRRGQRDSTSTVTATSRLDQSARALRREQSRSELVDEILSDYMRTPIHGSKPSLCSSATGGDDYYTADEAEEQDHRLSMPTSVLDRRLSVDSQQTVEGGMEPLVRPAPNYTLREGPHSASGSLVSGSPSRRSMVSRISRVPSIIDAYEARLSRATTPQPSRPEENPSDVKSVAETYRNATLQVDADSPNFIDFRKSRGESVGRQPVSLGAAAVQEPSFLDMDPADQQASGPDNFLSVSPPQPTPEPTAVGAAFSPVRPLSDSSPRDSGLLSVDVASPGHRSTSSLAPPSDRVVSGEGRQSWRSAGSNNSQISLTSQLRQFPAPPQSVDHPDGSGSTAGAPTPRLRPQASNASALEGSRILRHSRSLPSVANASRTSLSSDLTRPEDSAPDLPPGAASYVQLYNARVAPRPQEAPAPRRPRAFSGPAPRPWSGASLFSWLSSSSGSASPRRRSSRERLGSDPAVFDPQARHHGLSAPDEGRRGMR